jgi:hypothetical protein
MATSTSVIELAKNSARPFKGVKAVAHGMWPCHGTFQGRLRHVCFIASRLYC